MILIFGFYFLLICFHLKGPDAVKQLDCYDSTGQDKVFCPTYKSKNVNCTNLNYEKRYHPKWECEFDEDEFNDIVEIDTFSMNCKYPDQFDRLYKQYYLSGTCYLRYKLKLLKSSSNEEAVDEEDAAEDDNDDNEGEKDDRSKLLMLFYLLIACLSTFFFVITVHHSIRNLKGYNEFLNALFCCFCSRSSIIRTKELSSDAYGSSLRTAGFGSSDLKTFKSQGYVSSDIAMTTFA